MNAMSLLLISEGNRLSKINKKCVSGKKSKKLGRVGRDIFFYCFFFLFFMHFVRHIAIQNA